MQALLRACSLGLALLLLAAPAGRAQERKIALTAGAISLLILEKPFESILIGDSRVVDVHGLNRMVVLEALAPGSTNIVFIDRMSIAIANVSVLVSGADAM